MQEGISDSFGLFCKLFVYSVFFPVYGHAAFPNGVHIVLHYLHVIGMLLIRLVNLMNAWKHEIKELMGGMGINSIEALRGNRLMLRGVGLTDKELTILGISHAGE